MLYKFFILAVVFGVIAAEPIEKRTFISNDDTYGEFPGFELSVQPDLSSIISSICSLMGIKTSAVSLAVTAMEWLISNFLVIIVGAVGGLGFCKVTGLCGISYEKYLPVSEIQRYATPENIETAERFLISAVEKYAEKKRSV